jgi:stress response protein SCP2
MDHPVLSKGANLSLLPRSEVAGAPMQVVVEWSDLEGTVEVDVSALLLGPDGRVRSDADFVFYNAPSGGDGSVRLLGKRTSDDRGEDRVAIDLEALPAEVESIVFAASLEGEPGAGFGSLKDLGLAVLDAAGNTQLRYEVTDAGPETAMVVGELYLRGEDWKFRAVGQGWDAGLAGLATDYGITVDNRPDRDDQSEAESAAGEECPTSVPPAAVSAASVTPAG